LSIKNYGLTSAHDITVHFPDNRVIVPDAQNSGTWSSTQDLQLAVSTLAPGQETFEWVAIMAAADKNGIRSAEVEVSCKNWLDERQEVTYRISHGPSNIFGKPAALSDVVNELGQISRILEGCTSSDRRAVLMESPRESKKRIFEE
jgi:flavorubredoxin